MTYAIIILMSIWLAAELLGRAVRRWNVAQATQTPRDQVPALFDDFAAERRPIIGRVVQEARLGAETQPRGDIHVLALVKGEERYVFLYEDGREQDVLRTFGRFAANPELSFTWYDAAVLSQKTRDGANPTQGN